MGDTLMKLNDNDLDSMTKKVWRLVICWVIINALFTVCSISYVHFIVGLHAHFIWLWPHFLF